jgi:hypothetical protein
MNASIYCAILKEKSGAPKEKIKGVSKTAGGSVLRQATFWPFTMPASGIRLLMARLVGGRQHDRQHEAANMAG